jgi:hypothetical protein
LFYLGAGGIIRARVEVDHFGHSLWYSGISLILGIQVNISW